jgi:hypothetical protein
MYLVRVIPIDDKSDYCDYEGKEEGSLILILFLPIVD